MHIGYAGDLVGDDVAFEGSRPGLLEDLDGSYFLVAGENDAHAGDEEVEIAVLVDVAGFDVGGAGGLLVKDGLGEVEGSVAEKRGDAV